MAAYASIGEKFGIIYTCNCGWLNWGHSYPGSSRPPVGTANLWNSSLLSAVPPTLLAGLAAPLTDAAPTVRQGTSAPAARCPPLHRLVMRGTVAQLVQRHILGAGP